MTDIIVTDTGKDIICILWMLKQKYNVNEIFRKELSDMMNYSWNTIKKYMKQWIDKGIVKELYDKGFVKYVITKDIDNDLKSYCISNQKRIERIISDYVYKRGDFILTTEIKTYSAKGNLISSITLQGRPHEILKEILVKLGQALGYNAVKEYDFYECKAKYDVVWIKSGAIKKVFEIQYHGKLHKALYNLECIWEKRNAEPILITIGEEQYKEALEIVEARKRAFERALKVIKGEKFLNLSDESIEGIREILTTKI
ncbi:MAG: hypothetical protein J7J82_03520 [Staphylothermus sp.]|nr:hypothetical protein [Staphylothermus sp.]